MKISNDQVKEVLRSYIKQIENKKSDSVKDTERRPEIAKNRTDSVTITARGEEVNKAKELYKKLPEVRQDLVDELKGKIQSESYDVTSKEVADKIIHRTIVDKTV